MAYADAQHATAYSHGHNHILIINSYHSGFSWTRIQDDAFVDEVRSQFPDTQFFIEFMDVKRINGTAFQNSFAQMLAQKYKGIDFGLIMTTDDVALQFAQSYATKLWDEHTPILASGINHSPSIDPNLHPGTSGIIESQGGTETISLALRQNPETNQFVVIADTTEVGMEIGRQIEEQARSISMLPIVRTPACTKDELLQFIDQFDSRTTFLLALYVVDKEVSFIDPKILADEISARAKGPVYIFNDIYSESPGVVGGHLNSGTEQGRAAGKIALRLMNGERFEDLPERTNPAKNWIFSHPALRRFGIPASTLPEGSIVNWKPNNFITRNPLLTALLLLGLSAQTLLIVYLLLNIIKRQAVTKDLSKSEAQLRLLIDHSPLAISISDDTGKMVMMNRKSTLLLGY
ncbi:MAG: hypothetical protein WC360_01720, partial [Opitutales bacterium]